MNRRPEDTRIFISQLQPDDFEKVPPNLSMRELYRRIYDWHKKNEQMVRATATDPVGYQNRYLHLVKDLPNPDQATEADIYFVCLNCCKAGINCFLSNRSSGTVPTFKLLSHSTLQ